MGLGLLFLVHEYSKNRYSLLKKIGIEVAFSQNFHYEKFWENEDFGKSQSNRIST